MYERKKLILAVDDAQIYLQIIQQALAEKFEVRLAKSGNMAMLALERVTPDLILLDIEMPGMSGFDVMDELYKKPHLRVIPVIFVTAHATQEFVLNAVKRGAKDYIVKPYEPELLRSKVNNILGIPKGE
jgi:putative two-component system response regulator